jgi:hypothetical protein
MEEYNPGAILLDSLTDCEAAFVEGDQLRTGCVRV